jgi:hypothetical protein
MESESMIKVNWLRLVGCGLLAGIVWIILGSIVTALLGRDFAAQPNNRLAAPTPGFLIVNVVLDLLEGISFPFGRFDRSPRPPAPDTTCL